VTRSTSGRSFLDSNILVYTDDEKTPGKQEAALALIERCLQRSTGVVSSQVDGVEIVNPFR
jgi:predicted nucleic acid-binding protein